MISQVIFALAFAAAIGSGVAGGIFFAFSSFVMAALGRIAPEQGAAAMKAINVTVINPLFMTVFLGTALLSLVLAGGGLFMWAQAGGKLLLAAGLLYLLGCFGVTMVFNVPLNNRLAAVDSAGEEAVWRRYVDVWTAWNHVRSAASILSAILFIAALLAGHCIIP